MQQAKKCENCKFYNSYYLIDGGRLKRIGGYCDNDAVHPYICKGKYSPKLCDNWQQTKKSVERYRDGIIDVLKDIQKRLADIELIIKDD